MFEVFRQGTAARTGNVYRFTCVMLAEPWSGVDPQDLTNGLAGRELLADELCLVIETPEPRHDQQPDTVIRRRRYHAPPASRSFGRKPLHTAHPGRPDLYEAAGFRVVRQHPEARAIRGNPAVGMRLLVTLRAQLRSQKRSAVIYERAARLSHTHKERQGP